MKHLKKMFFSVGLMFALFGCDSQEFYIKGKSNTPVIKTISYYQVGEKFNTLKRNLQIEKNLKPPKLLNQQNKTIVDTFGLKVETDIIKQVTLGDYTSYTMRIVKENENTIFYNLTIEDKGGESSMYIIQYNPTEYWISHKDEYFKGSVKSVKMNVLTQYSDLEEIFDADIVGNNNHEVGSGPGGSSYNGNPNYPIGCNGIVIVSMQYIPYPCGCQGHMPWECNGCQESPAGYDLVPYYYCQELPDYSGTDPFNSGGSSNNDNPNNTSITAIITPQECIEHIPGDLNGDCQLSPYEACLLAGNNQEVCDCVAAGGNIADCQDENDCENLQNLLGTDKTNLNYYINQLEIKHNANIDKEHAYVFKKEIQYSDPITDEVTYNYLPATEFVGTATSTPIVTDTKTHADIHLHTKGHGAASGIFSWGDIYNFGEFYSGLSNAQPAATFKEKNDISTMVFAPDPLNENNYNVYALTVKDANQLNVARQNEWNKWSNITDVEDRMKKINRDFGNKYKENKTRLERFFLDTFSNYGITLYKLENNQWKELTPDTSNNNGVTKKPCE